MPRKLFNPADLFSTGIPVPSDDTEAPPKRQMPRADQGPDQAPVQPKEQPRATVDFRGRPHKKPTI